MVEPLLKTKFYRPSLPANLLPRPHLASQLEIGILRKLTLISAPAGFGKTTLVCEWIAIYKKKAAWISLDKEDNDLTRFWMYFISALQLLQPVIGEEALDVLCTSQSVSIKNILTMLINEISSSTDDLVIVLDDYHFIESLEVHTAFEFLLQHQPKNLHLVVTTRCDPPWSLHLLRSRQEMLELRQRDLSFSLDETEALFNQALKLNLSIKDIQSLRDRTEGWVVGLQLAAISMQGQNDAPAFIKDFTDSNRFIFEYLIVEVLRKQPREIQEFLLKTSILDFLCAPLCNAVIERGNSQEILEQLERTNLFIISLDDEKHWYRYHHLFANLLRGQLGRAKFDQAVLHRRACFWYQEHGKLPEALHHALAADEMEIVARIISSNVLVLVEHAELAPILLQINATPRRRKVLPWQEVAQAWGQAYTGQMEHAGASLWLAEKHMNELASDECSRLAGHIAAVRAYLAWVNGSQLEAVKYAEQAERLLPPEEISVRSLNLTTLGNALTQYAADPRSAEVLEQALSLARNAGQSHTVMLAASALAYAYKNLAQFHRAYDVCQEAIEIADEYHRNNGRTLSAVAGVYAELAGILGEWGEIGKAIQVARKGLALSERWGQVDTIMLCLIHLANSLALNNELQNAEQVLQRARELAKKVSPWFLFNVEQLQLGIFLDSEGQEIIEVHRKFEAGMKFSLAQEARLLVKQSRLDEALSLVERALPESSNIIPSLNTIRLYITQSLAFYLKREESRALAALKYALQLAEPENLLMIFLREGEVMERLLRLALEKSIAPGFVRRLLTAFETRIKYSPKLVSVSHTLIEPLSCREMDVLQLLDTSMTSNEIAETLIIAVSTARTHIKHIYAKLGVSRRFEAVQRAKEFGLI